VTSNWIQVQGAILAALVGVALIVNIQLRKIRPRAWLWYSMLSADLSAWGVLDAVLLTDVSNSSILGRLHTVLGVAVPFLVFGFLKKLFNDNSRLARQLEVALAIGLGLAVVLVLPGVPGCVDIATKWDHAYVFGSLALVLLMVLRRYREEKIAQERGRMAFVLLPMGIGVLVSSLSFSPLEINFTFPFKGCG